MKKVCFYIIFLSIFSDSLYAAISGNGTPGNPYTGTLTGSSYTILPGTQYFHQIVITGGTLFISPGTRFLARNADSYISTSGANASRIVANGTIASPIIISGDTNADGISQPGDNWRNISITNNLASNGSDFNRSVFNYCTIELGSGNPIYGGGSGGGIYASNKYLTISNSIIRNNSTISGGGGISIAGNYVSTAISITNCLIIKNAAANGGGINIAAAVSGTINFFDCVIANNTATTDGNNICYSNPTLRPVFFNSIIWPGQNSIYYNGISALASDFQFCALLDGLQYTNCIILGDLNTASTGPNFTNPLLDDYSIAFKSPCRDAAGDGNGSPLSVDIIGNNRIGSYDIGAYEVQYSRWTGNTSASWSAAGNWEQGIFPSIGTHDVVVPNAEGFIPDESSVTIASGNYLVLEPGGTATFGTLVNNGTLRLESDVTGIASLILGAYTDNGNEEIELYLTGGYTISGGQNYYRWHYISPPVTSIPTSVFTNTTLNLAQYYESLVAANSATGWVAFDGYVYTPVGQRSDLSFSQLNRGIGYNYYNMAHETYTFSGPLNTSDLPIVLAYSTGAGVYPASQGFNLIGNPFSSCIDWDQIEPYLPSNMSHAIFFTVNGRSASYAGGVGQGGATSIIPPMQGFFVKSNLNGIGFTIPASSRIHDKEQIRYKGSGSAKGSKIIPLIRLQLKNQIDSTDAVIRFDINATPSVDELYDALLFSKTGGITGIWTKSDNNDFSINGLSFPQSSSEIPVGIFASAPGTFELSSKELIGLEKYNVLLKDKTTNLYYDLKTGASLTITLTSGTTEDRFVLVISNILTSIQDSNVQPKDFRVYSSNGAINIYVLNDSWEGKPCTISIYDLRGRKLLQQYNIEWDEGELIKIPVNLSKGLYIIEINNGSTGKYSEKVSII